MIFLNDFSISKNAAADHRAAMPGCHRQTRRVRSRTPECGLSTILLVAKHRSSDGGTSSRLMVKNSAPDFLDSFFDYHHAAASRASSL